jgi:hypothetical protein
MATETALPARISVSILDLTLDLCAWIYAAILEPLVLL